jgi:hypothetical protein
MPVSGEVYFIVVLGLLLLIAALVYDWAVSLPPADHDPLAPKTYWTFMRTLALTCLLVALVAVAGFFLFFRL